MADSTGLNVREISELLPHRQPMLLVDRVVETRAGRELIAIKNVTVNEDYFRGHFPGNPVMPGVLILEALAQAAGLLIAQAEAGRRASLSYLVGVDGAKFRRPVVPGDRLELAVEVLKQRGRFWRFKASASVAGERAAEADILLAVIEASEVDR